MVQEWDVHDKHSGSVKETTSVSLYVSELYFVSLIDKQIICNFTQGHKSGGCVGKLLSLMKIVSHSLELSLPLNVLWAWCTNTRRQI